MARGSLRGITLQIGGDTTKLQKALTDVNREVKVAQDNLKQFDKALKIDPGNTDLIAGKQKELQKAIEGTTKRLELLREADKTAKQQLADGKITAQDYAKLKTEIAYTTKELNKLTAESSKTYQSLKQISETTGKFGDKAQEIGGKLTRTVTPAITALGVAGVKFAADAEAMTAQFEQVFGDSTVEATKSLEKLAKEAGALPNRLKPAFTSMAAFGKTAGMDTAESLDLATRATAAAADSAAFYDRSLEDVTESLQSFLKGNYANDAALGISATETTRNTKANELYGKSFKDLSESQKQVTLLAMVEDGNKLSGALGQAARESDTLTNQLGNLQQQSKDTLAQIAAPLIEPTVDVLKSAGEVLGDIAEWFGQLDPKMQRFILGLAATSAAAGPVISSVGGVAKGISKISGAAAKAMENGSKLPDMFSKVTGALTSPIGMTAALVAAAGALIYLGVQSSKASPEVLALAESGKKIEQNFKNSTKEIEANAYQADLLAKKIETLAQKEKKSAGEKKLLQTYVQNLNSLVPDLGLAYDELSDKLNMSTGSIRENITAMKEQALATAYGDKLQEQAKLLAETNIKIEETTEVYNRLRDVQDKFAKESTSFSISDSTKEELEAIGELYEALTGKRLDYAGNGLARALGQLDNDLKTLGEVSSASTASFDKTAKKVEEINTSTATNFVETSDTIEKAVEEQAAAVEDNSTRELTAIEQKVLKAKDLQDQLLTDTEQHFKELNAIDTAGLEEGQSHADKWLADMQENNQRQIEVNQNLLTLSGKIPKEMIKQLEAAKGDQSQLIAELAAKTPEELQAWVDEWTRSAEIAGQTSMNRLKLGIDGSSTLPKSAIMNVGRQMAAELNLTEAQYRRIGRDLVLGLKKGVDDNVSLAVGAVRAAGYRMVDAGRRSIQAQSPAKKFVEIGHDAMWGLEVGVEQNMGMAASAVESAGEEMINAAQSSISDINGNFAVNPALMSGGVNTAAITNNEKTAINIESMSIREEADIHKVASELDRLMSRKNRGLMA